MSRSTLAPAATLAAFSSPGLLDPSAAAGTASGVVVSEVRFREPAGPNAGAAPVDTSGWKLQACAAASGDGSVEGTLRPGLVATRCGSP